MKTTMLSPCFCVVKRSPTSEVGKPAVVRIYRIRPVAGRTDSNLKAALRLHISKRRASFFLVNIHVPWV